MEKMDFNVYISLEQQSIAYKCVSSTHKFEVLQDFFSIALYTFYVDGLLLLFLQLQFRNSFQFLANQPSCILSLIIGIHKTEW